MAPIESVEHGWNKFVSRKQKRANKVAVYVEDESNGAGAASSKRRSNCYSEEGDEEIAARDEKKVVPRKQKSRDRAANKVAVYVEDESNGAGVVRSNHRSNCYGEEIVARDENLEAEETKKLKPNKEKEKQQISFSEAAEKITPSSLEISLIKISKTYWLESGFHLLRFVDFFGRELSDVQFSWPEMFKQPSLFKLVDVIDFPLSYFPESVCKTSSDWINQRSLEMLGGFVLWAADHIVAFMAAEQGGPPHTSCKSQVSIFVALAMVLRSQPNALTDVLPNLRAMRYQGPDKLPFIVWMMAQATQGDLSLGLFSWAHNLLPLVGSNPQTRDIILQLVEKILSNPNARTIIVNKAVSAGVPVIPPSSFEILLRLTFPASSARVKATERFEAIYPLLKEVALAGEPGSMALKQVTQQIFTFSLKLAQEGNPVLAKEATAIAIRCVTINVDCCKHWGSIYEENLEASVAVLKKLVDEWNVHSRKLSSSRSHTRALNRTMTSFRLKNEKAIIKGGANGSLYKEADESCKVILGRISRGSGCLKGTASPRPSLGSGWLKGTASLRLSLGSGWLKGTAITAVVLTAAGVLSFNLGATTVLETLVDSWICTCSSMQPPQL